MPTHDPTPLILGGSIAIFAILALIGLASTIFWIVELVDVARRDFPDPNAKIIWLLIIFFFHFIGALIYYFVGKPQGTIRQYPPNGS